MYGWHMGGGGLLFIMIILIVLVGGSAAVGVALGLAWGRQQVTTSPQEVARQRLARGEITPEQYAAITDALRPR